VRRRVGEETEVIKRLRHLRRKVVEGLHSNPNSFREQDTRMGVLKLTRQLSILDGRIKAGIERVYVQHQTASIESIAELVLDLETYYTVAHDALCLAEKLLAPGELRSFRTAPIRRTIRILRNQKIRHSYNKPDGDPYGGIAYSEEMGPALCLGSPYADFDDPGYYANRAALEELLSKNDVYWLYDPALRNTMRMIGQALAAKKGK
jgi:hypothetical protein